MNYWRTVCADQSYGSKSMWQLVNATVNVAHIPSGQFQNGGRQPREKQNLMFPKHKMLYFNNASLFSPQNLSNIRPMCGVWWQTTGKSIRSQNIRIKPAINAFVGVQQYCGCFFFFFFCPIQNSLKDRKINWRWHNDFAPIKIILSTFKADHIKNSWM